MVQSVPGFQSPCWSLHVPGGCSVLLGFAPLPWSLLSQAFSSLGYWLSPSPVEFATSGLCWPRLPAQTCFCKSPWSGSAPAEFPGLGLVLQRCLALIWDLGGPRLGCTLDLRKTWLGSTPSKPRFMPGPTQRSLAQKLLPCTCSCGVHGVRSAPAQVAGSVLHPQMSLVCIHSCSHEVHHPCVCIFFKKSFCSGE